ncbi:MAG TPA: alpha-amylase family glycosyl hydrolase [Candidatus Polarisedimenticolaceae bacterium]
MRSAYRLLLGSALASALVLGGCAPASAPPQTVPVVAVPEAPPKERVPWDRAVLYFVVLDRFADGDPSNNRDVDRTAKGTFHGGDLKGLRSRLDEIADLGVTALWITPVVQNVPGFVTGAGFPDWAYHGYWPDDFTAIDPRFGTEADLKGLVEDAHRRGIRVLLDVVYNHAGYNTRYLSDVKTRNWFRSEERGTCGQDDLTSCVSGLPDWKTEVPEVQDFVMLPQLDLARRVGLDGFRLDTVKHVDHPFWKVHRERTRAVSPDFFLLGEVWGGDAQVLDPWFSGDEMDAGFDFGFQGSTLGFVQGRGRAVAYDRYLKAREKVRPGHLLSHFLSSHDVPGALFQLQGNKDPFRLAAVLQMTTGGIPMIYYGEEVGRPGGDWPDNRSPMPWGQQPILPGKGLPRDEALRDFYRKLIAARNELPELATGSHVSLVAEGDLLVFGRRDADAKRTAVVAVNRGASEARASFALPEDWTGAVAVADRLSGEAASIANGNVEIQVPPRGARILALASGPAR